MMKGKFKYDNKTFRWRFKITKDMNHYNHVYGEANIYYKNKIYSALEERIYIKWCLYNSLINEYSKMSDEEIKDMVKEEIIKKYEFRKAENRFS